jgi:hypothetical protein
MLQLTMQHYKVQQKVLWKESLGGRRVGWDGDEENLVPFCYEPHNL